MKYICSLFAFAVWIAGIVLAKGFWFKLLAFIFPPAAWYFVIETLVKHFNLV